MSNFCNKSKLMHEEFPWQCPTAVYFVHDYYGVIWMLLCCSRGISGGGGGGGVGGFSTGIVGGSEIIDNPLNQSLRQDRNLDLPGKFLLLLPLAVVLPDSLQGLCKLHPVGIIIYS